MNGRKEKDIRAWRSRYEANHVTVSSGVVNHDENPNVSTRNAKTLAPRESQATIE
jgi:hypothetical protein